MDNPSNVSTEATEFAKGALVKDPSSGAVYKLVHFLRLGNFSLVYAVELVDGAVKLHGNERPKVAKFGYISPEDMKDPHKKEQRLTDLKQRYDLEEKIIRGIREASKDRFVPAVSNGIWQEDHHRSVDTSLPVLIMERMGSDQEDWSLAHQVRQLRQKGQLREAEQLAVKAGAQYAELLHILYAKLQRACPDRKPGDFYWDPVKKALYVLDWNVVKVLVERPSDQSTEPPESVKEIQAEIRQFGEHWFEMLVGSPLSKAKELNVDNPASGSVWSQLSRGMRRLLKRTWRAGSSSDGLESDKAVVGAWEEYSKLVGLAPQGLYQQAEAAKDKAEQLGLDRTKDWNETWEMINDIQALLGLSRESDAKARAAEIKTWISNRDQMLERLARQGLMDGEASIETGNYDEAASLFRNVAENGRVRPVQRMKATRWWAAAEMLSAAVNQSVETSRNLKTPLRALLQDMEAKFWESARQRVEQIRTQHAVPDQLRYLETETQFCLALNEVSDTNLAPSDRLKAYEQAEKALKSLRTGSKPYTSTYADLLEETNNYADAATVANELKEFLMQQETRQTDEQKIRGTLMSVADELGKCIDMKVWPSNLAQVLEPWSYGLHTPPYLRKLISLDRIIGRDGFALTALDIAEEAYRSFDGSDSGQKQVRDNLRSAVYELGMKRMAEFDGVPRWPYKVADGIRFGERLSRLALFDENQKRDINGRLVKLKEYRDLQERLRKDAGILKPVDVWRLERLQEDKIDQSLNEALSKGVELFNPIPDDQDPGKTSIARLKEAREAVDLIVLLKALSSIQSQGQELASVAGDLRERIRLVVDSTNRGQHQPDAVHEIADASTNTIRSSIDEVGRDVTKSEDTLATNGSSSLLSAGDQVPPVTESGGVGGNQHETNQSGKRRVGFPSSLRSKPVLFGAAAIGIITAILLLWTHVLPLIRVPKQIAATDGWKVTIVPDTPLGDSEDGTYSFLISVIDDNGSLMANQDITVTTSGDGFLSSEQIPDEGLAKTSRFSLQIRTNESGAILNYGPAASGDRITVTVALADLTVQDSYEISNVPSPSPTTAPEPVATSTSVPEPQLSLTITGAVDGLASEIARPGQKLNYTIAAANQGDGAAQDVTLRCTPPPGATLTSRGEFEESGGFLSRQWTLFAAGQTVIMEVPFIVGEDASVGTDMFLRCSLSYANNDDTSQDSSVDSSVVKFAGPEPIRIILQPQTLDIGINESLDLKILVQQGGAGRSIASRDLTIQVVPATLLAEVSDPLTTDANGEVVAKLQGLQAGRGEVRVVLHNSDDTTSAVLFVRPVAGVPTANIRRSPSESGEALTIADRSRPFPIIGKLQQDGWLQVRLPDGTAAWVNRNTQGTTVSGDLAVVEVIDPASETRESGSSFNNSGSRPQIEPGERQLDAQSGSAVAFYRINRIEDSPILFLPPQGVVEVLPPESSTPPNEYVLVEARFWVKQEFVSSGLATWSFQNSVSDDWACWQAPGGDPATQPENCGSFPRTVGGPIILSSNVAPLEDNGWRQVVIKAWVKQENLAP